MTEECNQYLAQLQKDWERHRVKLGVEALRKEVSTEILYFRPTAQSYCRSVSETETGRTPSARLHRCMKSQSAQIM